jgi:cold shock CspA family protein
MEIMEGIIEYMNDEKGFGFIKVENYPKNVFFHASDCRIVPFVKLRKGDTVKMSSISQNEKGFMAKDVTLITS